MNHYIVEVGNTLTGHLSRHTFFDIDEAKQYIDREQAKTRSFVWFKLLDASEKVYLETVGKA